MVVAKKAENAVLVLRTIGMRRAHHFEYESSVIPRSASVSRVENWGLSECDAIGVGTAF